MDRKRQIRKLSKEADNLLTQMISEMPNGKRKDALILCSVIGTALSMAATSLIKRPIKLNDNG